MKSDQADEVVRIALPQDTNDLEAVAAAVKHAVAAIDRIERQRKSYSDEIVFLDAAGNKILTLPRSSEPQFLDENQRDYSNLPNFQYAVAIGPGEQRIVVRIEWEGTTLQ